MRIIRTNFRLTIKSIRVILRKATALILSGIMLMPSPWQLVLATNGPSQPEFTSFQQADESYTVDTFTGDFSYNINLLTVPGPGGGYPINLSYQAGIMMEQEASWTGLGWNLNVGAINRTLRGLPDDCKADTLKKLISLKPNTTVSIGSVIPFTNPEFWGFDLQGSISGHVYHNTYTGIGFIAGMGVSAVQHEASKYGLSGSLNLNYDTQSGIGLQSDLSLNKVIGDRLYSFSGGASLNSRQGMQGITFGIDKRNNLKYSSTEDGTSSYFNLSKTLSQPAKGAGLTFAKHASLSTLTIPMHGTTQTGEFKIGSEDVGVNLNMGFIGSVTTFTPAQNQLYYLAYGYLYENEREGSWGANELMDFNRENETAVNENIPYLPIPVHAHDVYQATAQGLATTFRPFQSRVTVLQDPYVYSQTSGNKVGIEYGQSSGTKIGFNYGMSFTESYSGDWSGDKGVLDILNAVATNEAEYEPFYFKASGELSSSTLQDGELANITDDYPVALDLSLEFRDTSFFPVVKNDLIQHPGSITNGSRSKREKRSQFIAFKTVQEVLNDSAYYNREEMLFPINRFPKLVTGKQFDYNTADYMQQHHIAKYQLINPDGTVYEYDLPVYNTLQKEVVFSIDGTNKDLYTTDRTTTYSTTDASTKNNKGEDNFYSATFMPSYSQAHLLTCIKSVDYIDLTHNGPSEDDFGTWIKFNYSKTDSAYNWRVPYANANYLQNYISNPNDDKASYVYGSKDVYYLNSVETKTHIAQFYVSNRHDGYGASQEHNMEGSLVFDDDQALKKLDKILLYSKKDLNNPLTTVYFEYDYSLCPNETNNDGAAEWVEDDNINNKKGKLTLKKVWFQYENNTKGVHSPYLFAYDESNPKYNNSLVNRWGTYQPDRDDYGSSLIFPYSSAQKDSADKYANSWNLKEIITPHGSKIKVAYEADDYKYVQQKQAQSMFKILFTGTTDGTQIGTALNEDYLRIYFQPQTPLENYVSDQEKIDAVKSYVEGINEMYFKTFMYLKDQLRLPYEYDAAYDYVEGYVQLNTLQYGYHAINGTLLPYVTVKEVTVKDNDNSKKYTHPFTKAGWQYLKLQRPDLLYPATNTDGTLQQLLTSHYNAISDFEQAISGYYDYCKNNNFCSYFKLNLVNETSQFYPSMIRLNDVGQGKTGGGHRVKSIKVSDEWKAMSGQENALLGLNYSYLTADSLSSGVAEYEPITGGEENALRQPVRYSTEKYNAKVKDHALYIEYPLGESFYPAPKVGYSRVIIKSLANDTVTYTANGIQVKEYYTARDFPVITQATVMDKSASYERTVSLPFVGNGSFNVRGYAQGYAFELNNMHGKLKAEKKYISGANLFGEQLAVPVVKNEYLYYTEKDYNPYQENKLSNLISVLEGHRQMKESEMGITRDFYFDERENYTMSFASGLSGNIDMQLPLVTPTAFPNFEFSYGMFRSLTSVKVITRSGILKEVRKTVDGVEHKSLNILYDQETGVPLLTAENNEFEDWIYSYHYPAHWYFEGMKGAYKNQHANHSIITDALGYCSMTNASTYFSVGDMLMGIADNKQLPYWVKEVNNSTFLLIDEQGKPAANMNRVMYVANSGYNNQLAQQCGSIVSLSNPVYGNQLTKLFSSFNKTIGNIAPSVGNAWYQRTTYVKYSLPFQYYNCETGDSNDVVLTNFNNSGFPDSLTFYLIADTSSTNDAEDCIAIIIFPEKINNPQDYSLHLEVDGKLIARNNATGKELYCTFEDNRGCYSGCFQEVIDASITLFDDKWKYNWLDYDKPVVRDISGNIPNTTAYYNPFRYGEQGVWRPYQDFVYLTERKQTIPYSNIRKDGTFDTFYPFTFDSSYSDKWKPSNEITSYNPDGNSIETKNALNIYSASIYGYQCNRITATVTNASNTEVGFEGFEDHYSNNSLSLHEGHGHFNFKIKNVAASYWYNYAHTGNNSLPVHSASPVTDTIAVNVADNETLLLQQGKKYLLSAWVNLYNEDSRGKITIINGADTIGVQDRDTSDFVIENFYKIDIPFTVKNNSSVIIELSSGRVSASQYGTYAFFDDIRLRPFNSDMTTYIYDAEKLRLSAELDEQNYATYYIYNEQGNLVQTKKETEKGVYTLQEERSQVREIE